MKDIRKVVIPVAGRGTRSLPATKNIPKEMLPIYNKPVIQYVVEEAQRAHIKDVIFVTNRDKNVIEDHFDHNLQLEDLLERSGKLDKLEELRRVAEMVNILSLRQKRQLGLGHAVLCARELVGDEPFAVMVGDDLMFSGVPGIGQLIEVAMAEKMPVIGVMEVPWEKVSRYGIIDGEEVALTRTEFNILELLMARPQKVFTKQELFELAWGEPYSVEDSTVNVHVSNLRRKLKPTGTDNYLQTVWGMGYKLHNA